MQEKIALEIIHTIGGKYGLTKVKIPEGNKHFTNTYNQVRNFVNLVIVHASSILNNVAIQKKVTKKCKKLLGNVDNASLQKSREEKEMARQIYIASENTKNHNFKGTSQDFSDEQYTKIGFEQNKHGADKNLNCFVRNADPDSVNLQNELTIEDKTFEYKENNVEEIIELEKVLCNPKHLLLICELAFSKLKDNFHAQFVFNSAVKEFVDNTFDFRNNTMLRAQSAFNSAVEEYVDNTFDFRNNTMLREIAINYFMSFWPKASRVLSVDHLKLENNCGYDIFGNRYVCAFNSLFNTHRRNPDNKEFVSAGGILTNQQVVDLYKSGGYPNIEQSENGFIEKYGFDYGPRLIPENSLNQSFATNDISSRGRTMLAFLVWTINTNARLSQSKYIKQEKKDKLRITEYRYAIKNDVMDSPMSKFTHSYTGIGNPVKHPFPPKTHLTQLHLLLGYIPNTTDPEYIQMMMCHNLIYAAMGINVAYCRFYNSEEKSVVWFPSKDCNFWTLIPFYSFSCVSPFISTIICVEYRGHVWSATQKIRNFI
ncbi:MAG: hypothetical protein LBP31_01870 [Holosporales bacterium]|jgi:hypothetical protein|nr:hypothetical protein [Holosporales bacterium]